MLEKLFLFLKSHLYEGLLLLVIIGFFFAQRPDAVFMMIILFVYLFIVLLNDAFISRIKKGIGDVKKNRQYGMLFLMIITLMFIWQFGLESIIFIVLFIAFALYRWDSRLVAGGALISLISSLILLVAKQDALAEQMAVYAFYLLAMTVVLQIIEFKRHPEVSDKKAILQRRRLTCDIVPSHLNERKT